MYVWALCHRDSWETGKFLVGYETSSGRAVGSYICQACNDKPLRDAGRVMHLGTDEHIANVIEKYPQTVTKGQPVNGLYNTTLSRNFSIRSKMICTHQETKKL